MELNKKIISFALISSVLSFVSAEGFAGNCEKACQQKLVEDYFLFFDKVMKKGSTEKDIANLFALFHADVKYEHLEYEASFNREEWHEAFVANLKRGAYQAPESEAIKVSKLIFGKSHVAVEYQYGTLTDGINWQAKDNNGLLALFGFKDSKIVLLREYW